MENEGEEEEKELIRQVTALGSEVGDFDFYPVLPHTSMMHLFSAPSSAQDFDQYDARLRRWKHWTEKGLDELLNRGGINTRAVVGLNYPEILSVYVTQERQWKAQVEFTELVIEHPTKDVLGYWYQGAPRVRTLDTLCSRTGFSRMLTREPNPELEFNHHYDELSDMNSRLHVVIRSCSTTIEITGITPVKTEFSCMFMLDFTPKDVYKVRAMFPRTRIVGIAVPRGAETNTEILAVLRMKGEKGKKTTEKEKGKKTTGKGKEKKTTGKN